MRDAVRAWAERNGHSYRPLEGIATWDEMLALLRRANEGKFVHLIYVAARANADWIFQFRNYLDKCVIVFGGLPDPAWASKFKLPPADPDLELEDMLMRFGAVAATRSPKGPEDTDLPMTEAPVRTLWVGLQDLPDYGDSSRIAAFQEKHPHSFGARLEQAARREGGLFIHL